MEQLEDVQRIGLPIGEPEPLRLLSIGVSPDGGLMVMPPKAEAWWYASATSMRLDHVHTTTEAIKLHWHRSGQVSATVSGSHPDFEKASAQLSPLERPRGQTVLVELGHPQQWVTDRIKKKNVPKAVAYLPNSPGLAIGSVAMRLQVTEMDPAREVRRVPDKPLAIVRGLISSFYLSLAGYGREFGVRCDIVSSPERNRSGIGFIAVAMDDATPGRSYVMGTRGFRLHVPGVAAADDAPGARLGHRPYNPRVDQWRGFSRGPGRIR